MSELFYLNRHLLETMLLPGPLALIQFADPGLPFAVPLNKDVRLTLQLRVHDCTSDAGLPTADRDTAQQILRFVNAAVGMNLVIQCEAGVGRSAAVAAALGTIRGMDVKHIIRKGTYNRRLYALLLEAADVPVPVEPLVSIAVRVKYPVDRLQLFLLSMKRQRYQNWECVVVTDGLNGQAKVAVREMADDRITCLETPERRGLWGHPHRQAGLEACHGAILGTNNDDNYLTPGYIEQLVWAIQDGADIAACRQVHSYIGWNVMGASRDSSTDLCCWLAKRELVRQVPWTGTSFTADGDYFKQLAALGKLAVVERPLVVKN